LLNILFENNNYFKGILNKPDYRKIYSGVALITFVGEIANFRKTFRAS